MSLKFSVDTLDGVPAEFHSLYAEKDGKFTLQVDGAVPKARLDEFRNSNVTLKQQNEALAAQFDGIDPEVARDLISRAQKEKDKKLIDAGKVDELVEQRVAAMRADNDKIMKALTAERDGAKTQLEGLLIDGALRDAAAKAGVRPTAIDDVLLRGRQTFKVVDGKAAAFKGDEQLFGKDSQPLNVAEWVGGLSEAAPHLFEPVASGAGSKGVVPGAGAGKGTISRSAFESLPLSEQATTARSGVKITD